MLTVQSLRRQLADLPDSAVIDVSIGQDRTQAHVAISFEPAEGDQPARVIIGAALTPRAAALEHIREALFGQGPNTPWTPDTLDEVADALREAGLAPEPVDVPVRLAEVMEGWPAEEAVQTYLAWKAAGGDDGDADGFEAFLDTLN
jgi:hypothetical protein